MNDEEHWRRRLLELKEDRKLSQAEMASAIGVAASYVSRLLYPPGKPGRKNLGLDTMRAIRAAYDLPADWFDLPLGSGLRNGPQQPVGSKHAVNESAEVRQIAPITWPFKQVSYKRLISLQQTLGERRGAEALRDIDEHLDLVVTKWERVCARGKKAK
jgi:transcriptional regulator with XRE-family HTH domain